MSTFLDFETRGRVDIRFGTDRYSAAAEPLILTYARDEDRPELWDIIGGEPIPRHFKDSLDDPCEPLLAHNAQFDRAIMTRGLRIKTNVMKWRCTMAMAYSHGLPGSLGTLGQVLELPQSQQKNLDDAKLIDLFCIPNEDGTFYDRTTHPAEWDRFCGYGLQDTVALRQIWKKLPKHNYQGENLETWWIDLLINERGFNFDAVLAERARDLLQKAKGKHDSEVSDATDNAVTAVTQRARLLKWFESKGMMLPNMRAATIREWLEHDDLSPEMRFLLELRLEGSKSSGSKYRRGLELVGADGRIRYWGQFNGAGRTGREAGRGLQPHNMQRPVTNIVTKDGEHQTVPVKAKYVLEVIIPGIISGDALDNPLVYGGPNEACANALRGSIIAAPGNELVVADWSNIESRILAWIADEDWKLEAYRALDRKEPGAHDLYKLLFSQFFGTPIDEIDDQMRQSGKVSELAFGFGGGVGALVTMAASYNMDLDKLAPIVWKTATEEQLKKGERAWGRAFLNGEDYGLDWKTYVACDVLKQVYRASNSGIDQLRHDVDKAVKEALRNPGTSYTVAKCKIFKSGNWLVIELPSGRRLLYSHPMLHTEGVLDIESGKTKHYEYVSYLTARGKGWIRERAWSGLFIENIVQAIANDCLRAGLRLAHADSFSVDEVRDYLTLVEGAETAICLHVHDEIALDVPKGSYPLPRLIECITVGVLRACAWARGLPLAAAGWIGPRYKKG